MKRLLPVFSFLVLLLLGLPNPAAHAQTPEAEPNSTLATANNMAYAATVTGQLLCTAGDDDDYFRVVLPAGTKGLRLITKAKMQSGTGALYCNLYNKYGTLLTNYYKALTTAWVTDTLNYPCFEGDTFFVRMSNWSGACKDYEFTTGTSGSFLAGADPEGNDAFGTATPLAFNFDTSGHLANQRYNPTAAFTDNDDYYRVVPPTGNKGLRLLSKWRSVTPGSTGAVYVHLYNKFQQLLTNKYVAFGNTWVNDTLAYPCFEGDTFYVRMSNWSGACKEYRLRTTTPNVYTVSNDAEGNDNFAAAPTIPFGADSSGHLASQRYGPTGSYTDNNDYYRVVAPAGNQSLRLLSQWRSVTPGSTGAVYVHLYNKFQQLLTNKYVAFGNTWVTDTLDYPCFEGDTFFVRMSNWSGECKEYTFNAGTANSFLAGDDPEVNDDLATATVLAFGTDTSGHLASQRYSATGSYTDNNDYYRVVAPAGNQSLRLLSQWRSVTPGSTSAVYVHLYNKAGTLLTNKYVAFGNAWTKDTLDYPCFEGDTFYVRMSNWSGNCKEYRLRPTTANLFSFAGDTEPNSTQVTATPLAFRSDTTGTLGTQIYGATGIYSDPEDYYRVVMPNNDRGIRVRASARMIAPGTTGAYYLSIYNKAGVLLTNKYISLSNTLKADTLDFPCFNSDTFYVRLSDWSGSCKEYRLRAEYASNGPTYSAFENTRFGNSFSFVNRSRNAESYLWTFGDGATDTTAYPVHDFGVGQFVVKLRATGFCGFQEFRDTVQVEGIEYFQPNSAATEKGYGAFNLRVFGAGLDTLAEVTLTKGSTVLRAMRRGSPSTKELTAQFSITDVDTGAYDLRIRLSNNQTFSYPGGFRIFEDAPGFGITTKITGPSRIRTGTNTNFSLVISNSKHQIANGVMAFIAVPEGVETNIKEVLRKRTGVLRIKGSDYEELSIPRDFYNKVYYGGTFNPETDVIEQDYNTLYQAFDSMVSVHVDTLLGQPYKGTLYPILVHAVEGQGTWSLNFKLKTPVNGGYPVMSFAWPFTLRHNPMSGESLEFAHDAGMNAAALAELTPNPALKLVGKSAGYLDIGSKVLFAEIFDQVYGTNVADEGFYAEQGVALTGELAGELLPTGKRVDAAQRVIKESKAQIARRCKNVVMDFELLQTSSPYYRRQLQENLIELSKRLAESENLLSRAQKEEIVNSIIHLLAKKGISKTTEEITERLFPKDVDRKPTTSVTSLDPNAIYGNWGPKSQQYLRAADVLSYLITFENVDTALAPAATVRVETQLDTNKYDLRRAYLGNVTIGNKLYQVEPDRRQYFRDIDLRPAQNLIVRLNAHMDSTGRAYWEFTSLDPATMNVPEDPSIGFLPPNVSKGEGEGSVSFFAHLKPGLTTGDSFSAQAKIFFDANAPIETERWMNTIDETQPATVLATTVEVTNDSVMHLKLNGADRESGLDQFAVFMKVDSVWNPYPYHFFAGTDAHITGTPGHTYSFYAIAKDSVGNIQLKPQAAEVTVTLPARKLPEEPGGGNASFALYPNPSTGQFFIRSAQDRVGATLAVTDYGGRIVLSDNQDFKAGSIISMDLTSFANGIYLVRISGGGGATETYKVVLAVPRR